MLVIGLAGVVGAEPGFSSLETVPSAPNGLGASHPYSAFDCASATSCTVVGPASYSTSPATAPIPLSVVTETGGSWGTISTIAEPAAAVAVSAYWPGFTDVACPSAGDCTAVGGYATTRTGASAPMVASESGGVWAGATALAPPAGAAGGSSAYGLLTAVRCVSAGDCVALGVYRDTTGLPQLFTQVETAGVWGTANELPPVIGLAPGTNVEVRGLACRDLSDCIVVGAIGTPHATTFAWTETAGAWSQPVRVAPNGFGFVGLGVACPDPTTCIVVGEQGHHRLERAAYTIESGGVWSSVVLLPFPLLTPVSFESVLGSISCDTDAACEATGLYLGRQGRQLVLVAGAVTWSDGSWSSAAYVRVPRPPRALSSYAVMEGVRCVLVTACVGLGEAVTLSRSLSVTTRFFLTTISPTRPIVAPHPPTDVAASSILGGVAVQWEPPVDDGGAPVRSYTATVVPGDRSCTTAAERCAIRGLTDGHRYRVLVTDATSFGPSRRTLAHGVVPAGRVPGAPRAVRVLVGMGVLEIQWRAPSTPADEPVTAYVVRLRGPTGEVRTFGTHALGCRIGGATAGWYSVTVTARNATGGSSPSRPATATVR